MEATLRIKTNVETTAFDNLGRPKAKTRAHNLVTDYGLNRFITMTMDTAQPEGGGVGYGDDNTAPNPVDTALGNELQSGLGLWSPGSTGVCYVERTFAITSTETAREAGLYGDDLVYVYARAVFSGISLVSGDALLVKWTITLTDGSP